MKLTAFQLKDRLHLMDLINVGLIDESWSDQLPPELNLRLRDVIDEPRRESQQQP